MGGGSQFSVRLQEGIGAVKAGDTERARTLLLQVVQEEPGNEQAWLWFSSVVETGAERRLCLENVLGLTENLGESPARAAAQRGLAKLDPSATAAESDPVGEYIVRREYEPISTAAAILYPESQVKEWKRQGEPQHAGVPAIEYQAVSSFDDIWTQAVDICAYCAQELEWDEERCPRCGRDLIELCFRYKHPSFSLIVLFIMLVLVDVQSLALLAVNIMGQVSLFRIALHGLLVLISVLVTAGIYLRKPWSYIGSLLLLPTAFMIALMNGGIADAFTGLVTGELFDLGSTQVNAKLMLLLPLLMAATAFLFALTRVGPDFVRIKERRIAQVDQGLKWAPDYYNVGKRYAGQGMWATAILHWQRAAANEPRRVQFQRALGQAYARLGFHDRSLDVLRSAHRLTIDPLEKGELERMIESVKRDAGDARPAL